MNRLSASPRKNNIGVSLPLFEHADRTHVRSLPLAARRIARRFDLPAATALAVAELAGFSAGDR